MNTQKTYNVTSKDIKKKWYILDAEGKSMGRVALKAAYILRGKHKPTYTPYLDAGDNVVIINAKKAKVTGNKFKDKLYYHHTGFPGGLRSVNYEELLEKHPTYPMEKAVRGMLPNGPLGSKIYENVRIYSDAEYKEVSQKPEVVEI